MTNVLVTGASGFIGARLVWELIQRGHVVHALTHRTKLEPPPGFLPDARPDFDHPNIRLFHGDLSDSHDSALHRAMDGCSQVYHLASYAKNWAGGQYSYLKTNVSGLCNVCRVAGYLRVERVVWTSTVLTFGPTPRAIVADETRSRLTPIKCSTEYEASKMRAEDHAARYVKDGLPLVIVNPTRVFGPGHLNESNSVSRMIDMYDRGKLLFLLGGGRNVGNWVYVDDIVQGLILAMERGRVGEKYILGGENLSLKDFLGLVDRASGKRHFQITIRRPAAMTYAWLQKKRAERFGIYPQITPEWIRVFLVDWAYSSAKAQRELGYEMMPLEQAVRRTYEWLVRVRSESNSK